MTPALTEIRERVADAMRKHGVVHAAVFGSVARGEDQPDSDVDFIVEFEDGRTLLDLSALRLDLLEVLGRRVDVATADALHPRMRDRILKERVPLFDSLGCDPLGGHPPQHLSDRAIHIGSC